MSYQKACDILKEWDVHLSSSFIAKTSEAFETTQQELSEALLLESEVKPLQVNKIPPRVWMLEIDGMMMPTRGETQSVQGKTEYKEVKTAILYLKNTPSTRYQISTLKNSVLFAPLVHGLLRFAEVRQQDILVGLADGARWITNLFGDLGVHKHILDVYHASSYFETILVALGWSETARREARSVLLRGEMNLLAWMNWYLTPEAREKIKLAVNVPAGDGVYRVPREALAYLDNQTLLGRTNYFDFKQAGFEVIGSGEVEGANKSVLVARLKIGGARWGCGGDGKAFARGVSACVRKIIDFDSVRLTAFPKAA